MYKTTVHFGKSSITLECDNPERIKEIAEKINEKIESLRSVNNNTSETKLAYIVALMLQDELDIAHEEYNKLLQENKSLETVNNEYNKALISVAEKVEELANRVEKL